MTTARTRIAIGVERTLSEITAEVVDGKLVSLRTYADYDDSQTLWWLDHKPAANPSLHWAGPFLASKSPRSFWRYPAPRSR